MRTLLLAMLIISSTSSVSAQAPVQLSGTDKAANAPTDKVSDPDQAIKCRTVRVTGSLVKKGRYVRHWRSGVQRQILAMIWLVAWSRMELHVPVANKAGSLEIDLQRAKAFA
jgi:hypothetical protein